VAGQGEKSEQKETLSKLALEVSTKPLSPEKNQELLEEGGKGFVYGQGLGEAMLMLGTVVIFPPYALFLAGNAAAELAGYEPVSFSDALPEEGQKSWKAVYSGVTSVPGQLAATVSGEHFRTEEEAEANLIKILKEGRQQAAVQRNSDQIKKMEAINNE